MRKGAPARRQTDKARDGCKLRHGRGDPEKLRIAAAGISPRDKDFCLSFLRILGAQLLKFGRKRSEAPLLDAEDLELLLAAAAELRKRTFPDSLWAAVGETHLAGLLAVYSLALRRSANANASDTGPGASTPAAEREAYAGLRAALAPHFLPADGLPGAKPPIRAFLSKHAAEIAEALLRAQPACCYAVLLAQSASELATQAKTTHQAETGGGAHPPETAEMRTAGSAVSPSPMQSAAASTDSAAVASAAATKAREKAGLLLEETCVFLQVLRSLLTYGGSDSGNGKSNGVRLQEELDDSGLLEHWARAFLLLQQPPPPRVASSRCCRDEQQQLAAARLLCRLASVMESLACHKPSYTPSITRGSDNMVVNFSLSYLLASHVVRLAAALDGGSTYGMPAAGQLAPLVGAATQPQQQRPPLPLHSPTPYLDTRIAAWALRTWQGCYELRVLSAYAKGKPGLSGSLRRACLRELEEQRPQLAVEQAKFEAANTKTLKAGASFSLEFQRERVQRLERILAATAVLPCNVAVALDVSMRLAACARDAAAVTGPQDATAPAATAAAADSGAAGGRGDGAAAADNEELRPPRASLRPRVPPHQAVPLGTHALGVARLTLWDVGDATEAKTPLPRLQQLGQWWGAAADFVRVAARRDAEADAKVGVEVRGGGGGAGGGGGVWEYGDLLELLDVRVDAELSEEPAADVAAAIRVGYPQLVELLLRRSASAQETIWIPGSCHLSAEWAEFLTFGPPAEMASLLSTLAKVVRRAALEMRLRTHFDWVRRMICSGSTDPDQKYKYCVAAVIRLPTPETCQELLLEGWKAGLNLRTTGLRKATAPAAAVPVVAAAAVPAVPAADEDKDKGLKRADADVAAPVPSPGPGNNTSKPGLTWLPPRPDRVPGLVPGLARSLEPCTAAAVTSTSAAGLGPGEATGPSGSCTSAGAGPGPGPGASAGAGPGPGPGASAGPGAATGSHHDRDDIPRGARRLGRRLGLGLSHMAVRLLPEMSLLLEELAKGWVFNDPKHLLTDTQGVGWVLAWVPIVAAAAANAAAAAAAEAPAATAAAAAADWERLLWQDMRLPALLLDLAPRLLVAADEDMLEEAMLCQYWPEALRALAYLWPRRMVAELVSYVARQHGGATAPEGGGAAAAGGAARAAGAGAARRRILALFREHLGSEAGDMEDPHLLARLEAIFCGRSRGMEKEVMRVAAMAMGVLEREQDGGDKAGEEEDDSEEYDDDDDDSEDDDEEEEEEDGGGDREGALPSDYRVLLVAAAMLVPPGEVRAALPTCSNPACTNLQRDSEAGLQLAACGGRCGGAARYCSRECQTAHWKAGHKKECGKGSG
ncbi:hypothetical protein PLESTB_001046200 [Pleodorina starrii]|uniref:MYND-type domain-containing protein n=1 Tax=Pleodorina starrii TaxID=330485 RepID=A0A9W6F4I5_9CHLO|nr:hypothetical protein PLESTB_001046200 [Pleodorina starrii]